MDHLCVCELAINEWEEGEFGERRGSGPSLSSFVLRQRTPGTYTYRFPQFTAIRSRSDGQIPLGRRCQR
jgi:hypothetical protein